MDFVEQYTTDITIHAPAEKVWEVLTNADLVQEYLAVTVTTTWQKGSPIAYHHVYEGKSFEDKGVILDIVPHKLLRLAYLPAISDLENKPENYQEITTELTAIHNITTVTLTVKNIRDAFFGQRAPELWGEVLRGIKRVAER